MTMTPSAMSFHQVLHEVTFILQIAVNVIVAHYTFPAWRKLRQKFLLILAVSAAIGIFTGVVFRFLERVPFEPSTYMFLWHGSYVLNIADLILYAIGIVGMVRYLLAASSPAQLKLESA